jgi:hypothetical protein
MKPVRVDEFLGERGFQSPNLAVLAPNVDEYSLFASQPKGDIDVCAERIGNRSQQDAIQMSTRMLKRAAELAVDLMIAPEYSVPWRALIDSILADYGPPSGCLWALGCESITIAELETLQSRLGSHATVLYEPLEPVAMRTKGFLDPLSYVFVTMNDHGQKCTVILIQFKTHPSIDNDHIESEHLIVGSLVYVFGTVGKTIRLASLICSDVLEIGEQQIKDLYFASLILHIQLNPKPRESAYRDYRKQIFKLADNCTELICLNWAANINSWNKGNVAPEAWKNVGGSAWYLRPKKFDTSDLQITENHRGGLYYTWHNSSKCNVLFFNYEPGIYCFVATKVWHHAVPQVQSKQTGPRLKSILRWDDQTSDWATHSTSNDGFDELIAPWSADLTNLTQIYTQCPVATERVVALVQGNARSINWYSVKELWSFTIEEPEYVRRITFAQETEPACVEWRENQIRDFLTAQQAFQQFTNWPPELDDLKSGWAFAWASHHLHCNVLSNAGKYATVVYCADNTAEHRLRQIGDALREWLIRAGDSASRLAILFRENNQLRIWRHPESKRYDKPASDSPANFTEAT